MSYFISSGFKKLNREVKKLIEERCSDGDRHSGSIIEDAIIQLDSPDALSRLKNPSRLNYRAGKIVQWGVSVLSITWINRILFLKNYWKHN